ncbi:hypothetical protein D3C76_1231760 [compost metagenome]
MGRFDDLQRRELSRGIARQLFQVQIQHAVHLPGFGEVVQVDLTEVVEQTMHVKRLDALPGKRRHVLDQEAHAGNAILTFTDHQAGCGVVYFLDEFGNGC